MVVIGAGLGACSSGAGSDECAGPATADGGLKEVRIAFIGGLGTYQVRVAKEQGIFEKHGIDADVIQAASNSDFVPGLCKQYDVVTLTAPDMIHAQVQGVDVHAITGLVNSTSTNPNAALISTAQSGAFDSVDDLNGAVIGVVSFTAAGSLAIKWLLKDAGLPEDAATLTVVPYPAMIDQVAAGQIDAAMLPTPFYPAAVRQGLVAGFDPTVKAAGDPATIAFLATSQAWVDANPEVAKSLQESMSEAVDWIHANPEEALADVSDWLSLPPELMDGVPLPEIAAGVTAGQLAPWLTIMRETGILAEVPSVDDLVVRQ